MPYFQSFELIRVPYPSHYAYLNAFTRARPLIHIVNIGSLASLAPVGGLALYCATKFSVRGYSIVAAQGLKPHGVSVSLVMPDAVQTPMLDLQRGYDEAAMTFSRRQSLTVNEVSRAIIHKVLVRKPLEFTIPTGRGVLAKVANTAPGIAGNFWAPGCGHAD